MQIVLRFGQFFYLLIILYLLYIRKLSIKQIDHGHGLLWSVLLSTTIFIIAVVKIVRQPDKQS